MKPAERLDSDNSSSADPYRVLADGTVVSVAETDSPERRRHFVVRKQLVLAGVFAWSAVQGVLLALGFGDEGLIALLLNLPHLILGVTWCHLDAAERQKTIPFTLRIGLILIFGLALIVYLFESRGLRGFVAVVLAAAIVSAAWGVMYLTTVLTTVLTS